MANGAITIEDVARLAGVSIATVSRTLHRPDIVSEKTRKRVEQAIEATGYTTNAMARSLRTMQTHVIVVLVPNIGNPFFSEILLGIEAVASAHGFNILIGNTDNKPEREKSFAAYVRGHQADGMLLLNGHVPLDNGGRLQGRPAALPPMVIMCERIPGLSLPTVRIDNEGAAHLATRHLIELGHRSIAHIKGPEENILTKDRLAGYRRALEEAGIPFEARLVAPGDFSIPSGQRGVERILDEGPRPTAVFCSNDEMAMGAIVALKQRGLSVPGDVSVVGFDDIQFAGSYDPPLTTIHQPRRHIGETAMALMVELLESGSVPEGEVVIETELLQRRSSGPPRGA